ncbi:UDP-glucose 4-epimerase [Motilibacter rhizosphaerae]|uniref:UDP-glucose 4-epimerase n=1 Tax=Motilibacter rhizosphaerae TaxID=598652 RepID=A0A4Q7NX18_9ACTN|nr:NAD(P)-dependent oxidoreductase [Motilibacter rhizosphaerae]RZS91795.1 UDP-glucose 4-epimerase [Motilibacter rhizosphaerae]
MAEPRTVLVTGATGMIGSRLVAQLVQQGDDVHAVSREEHPPEDAVTWWRCDLADAPALDRVLTSVRPHVVHHLAAKVDGARTRELVRPTLVENLLVTVSLLEAVDRLGIARLVLSGSALEEPAGGDALPVPPSPYGASKWAASAYARMYSALFDLPVVTVRPNMTYGPGQRDLRKLVPYVILSLLRGEEPQLSSGARPCDWVFVDDVAAAYRAAGESPVAPGRTIDIGTGVLTTVADLVADVVRILGTPLQPRFGVVDVRPLEQVVATDPAPAQELLGWRPEVDLHEGLQRTVAWARTLVPEPRGHAAGERVSR